MEDPGIGINIMQDLQTHLQTANVPMNQLSKVAREGDEKVGIALEIGNNLLLVGNGCRKRQTL